MPLDELAELLLVAPPAPPLPPKEPLELLAAPPVPPDELVEDVVDVGGLSPPQAFAATIVKARRRLGRCLCMGR